MNKNILVVGSMNIDLVVQTDRYPKSGETIIGKDIIQIPGGKGANQAAAAGKLGGNVAFIGACGKDNFGDRLLSSLEDSGINISNTYRLDDTTGIANIIVDGSGSNRIIIIQGANFQLTPPLIEKASELIKNADVVLLQLEIPLESVKFTIELAKKYQTKVILDPAPAQKLPEEIFKKIDYLLPNEGELDLLLEGYNLKNEEKKIEQLLDWGTGSVLLTKGEKGITLYKKDYVKSYAAIDVEVVDTTAAGDAFAGAFAYGLVQGWTEDQAIDFAIKVSALSVTKLGAQSSLPTMGEVKEFYK